MRTIYITRRERFNAAHQLWNHNWSAEKNYAVFGKCSNPKWHGHNYELFVTVKGSVKQETGYLVDLKDLKTIINTKIIDKMDHKNINLEVDFMKNIMASTENICIAIWDQLENEIKKLGADLHCIKVVETENNYAEFYG
jgi:6-pyruvoyltetrahydropterin/6-carboxytetrahydropterin synthase